MFQKDLILKTSLQSNFQSKLEILTELKKRILSPLAFQQNHVSKKCCETKQVDLLSKREECKWHYVLIKDFNTFMYDHTLHRGRKHFVIIVY